MQQQNVPPQDMGGKIFTVAIRWLFLTAAVSLVAHWVDGITVGDFYSALFTAAVLGLLNVFVRPLFLLFTLPLNVLSLGLFTFVINAAMLKIAALVVPGFAVTGFLPAVIGAFLISIINWVLNLFLGNGGRVMVIRGGRWPR